MRISTLALPALCMLAAACDEKPSFDERFEQQKQELASEAAVQQQELDRRMEEKAAVEQDKAAAQSAPENADAK